MASLDQRTIGHWDHWTCPTFPHTPTHMVYADAIGKRVKSAELAHVDQGEYTDISASRTMPNSLRLRSDPAPEYPDMQERHPH